METADIVAEEITRLCEGCGDGQRMEELRGRVQRCCCSYCGSALVLRRITAAQVDEGRVEIFCPRCNRIEYGVEPEIFYAAKYYADVLRFDYYPDLDDSTRKRRMNIAKVNEIIQWGLQSLGLLGQEGFTGVVAMDKALLGQDLLIAEHELRKK